MIQRIQTAYLTASLACSVLLFFLPFWVSSLGVNAAGMEEVGAGTHFFLLPVAGLLVISHLVSIFTYKNRKRQKGFCTGNILLYLIFILLALVLIQLESHVFQNFNLMEFRLGAILPVIGIILNVMARNGIKKDEALVRSMDRLR